MLSAHRKGTGTMRPYNLVGRLTLHVDNHADTARVLFVLRIVLDNLQAVSDPHESRSKLLAATHQALGCRKIARPRLSIAEDAGSVLVLIIVTAQAGIVAEAGSVAGASRRSFYGGVEVVPLELGESDTNRLGWECGCRRSWVSVDGCVWVHRTGLQDKSLGEENGREGQRTGQPSGNLATPNSSKLSDGPEEERIAHNKGYDCTDSIQAAS